MTLEFKNKSDKMKRYIDAEKLKAEIQKRIEETKSMKPSFDQFWAGQISAFKGCLNVIDSLEQEQPEDYFYCKYGGTRPLCSDCKRNHSNSPYTTDDIKTWYCPLNLGTKQCSDYIKKQ